MVAWIVGAGLVIGSQQQTPDDPLHRAAAVRELVRTKCLGCHGDDTEDLRGAYDMRSHGSLLKGGESEEAAVVPGDAAGSPLFLAVSRHEDGNPMPPQSRNALTDTEVALVKAWIDEGARWPENAPPTWDNADGVKMATSGGLADDWTDRRYDPETVWAYRLLREVTPPGDGHPVDAFLDAELTEKNLPEAPAADRRTLIRRVTLDLTGLPPTPAEVEAFAGDDSPQAYEKLVDRLLASRHYGEQLGRQWLDVTRYADTAGFANDFERPAAWRYRDWVVRSFNADKPYDRFVVEQIAGDELAGDDPQLLVATGYLRMGPWEHTAMSVAAETRQQFLDDVTHAVGVTFLGQGLRCASCHDHKFDPIPTRDYYAIQAAFATTQLADRKAPHKNENLSGFQRGWAEVQQHLEELENYNKEADRSKDEAIAEFLKAEGLRSLDELPEGRRKEVESRFDVFRRSLGKVYHKGKQHVDRQFKRFEPLALSVYSGPDRTFDSNQIRQPMPPENKRKGKPADTHILTGGSIQSPGEQVLPGVLSAAAASMSGDGNVPDSISGRRLALARWIAAPDNPLTARVMVNRLWQRHFGAGIVATSNNFGVMGKKPTHPDLLDWLATRFVEGGWSVKQLDRLIVTSAAYRRASSPADAEAVAERDPNNALLSYFPPRRLAAEEIRDAMLAVTGELNPEVGGPPAYPTMNWEVALQPRHIMGSVAPAYQPDVRPADRNRRTIYAYKARTLRDPALEVFDQPVPDVSSERRTETTVAPQAFTLFNGQASHDRALALAADIAASHPQLEDRIAAAFERVYLRRPTEGERTAAALHVRQLEKHHRQNPPEAVSLPTAVGREMIEELTGEPVHWTERLHRMDHYQPDLKPWDVSPEVRALAELCLVLFNSNEFLYVD